MSNIKCVLVQSDGSKDSWLLCAVNFRDVRAAIVLFARNGAAHSFVSTYTKFPVLRVQHME